MTAHIDPLRADAEDADPLQAPLGKHNPGRHGGWQGRRHSDGDDIQRLDDDGVGRNLEGLTETGLEPGGNRAPSNETLSHLVDDAEDDGVEEADPCHAHQTQQELVGIAVQPEVGGFGVEDGSHQLALLCAEACRETSLSIPSSLCWQNYSQYVVKV